MAKFESLPDRFMGWERLHSPELSDGHSVHRIEGNVAHAEFITSGVFDASILVARALFGILTL